MSHVTTLHVTALTDHYVVSLSLHYLKYSIELIALHYIKRATTKKLIIKSTIIMFSLKHVYMY